MHHLIKQLIIIVIIFLVILWFQDCDDKRNNRTRKTKYEKYKLPVLVAAIIGLMLQANFKQDKFIILTATDIEGPNDIILSEKPKIKTPFLTSKDISDQQIFTDLPDF